MEDDSIFPGLIQVGNSSIRIAKSKVFRKSRKEITHLRDGKLSEPKSMSSAAVHMRKHRSKPGVREIEKQSDKERKRKMRATEKLSNRNCSTTSRTKGDTENDLEKIPKMSNRTLHVAQSEVNKCVKYCKRISIELAEINRIHHELVQCDGEENFEPGSCELIARRNKKENLESLLVSETIKPPGAITLEGCGRSTETRSKRRSSLIGLIPKRWQ